MGFAMRNGGSGTISVNVTPLGKTSVQEAGLNDLQLPDGTPIVALGYHLWPSHDEGAVAAVKAYLQSLKAEREADPTKPAPVVFLLGGMLHSDAFKKVADERDDVEDIVGACEIAEICKIRDEVDGVEERWLALAKLGGKYIAEFADACGGHVYYIPSISHLLPNEFELFRTVLKDKAQRDKWAEKHPKEGVAGPPIPDEFDVFLGLKGNPNVTVLNFGAAVRINKNTRFMVGDFRRRHPGPAAQVDVEQLYESVVRGFDGKISSAWWTTPKHTLGESHRRWWQSHEVGNMFDLSKQLGYLRDYDRRGKGLWVGRVVDGKVFGVSVPLLRGEDGRRGFVVEGEPFDEPTAGGYGNVYTLPTPTREVAPAADKPKAAAKGKRQATTRRKSTSK